VFFDDFENRASGNWKNVVLSAGIGTHRQNHWIGGHGVPPIYFSEFATSGTSHLWGHAPREGSSAVAMAHPIALGANLRVQFNHSWGFENFNLTDRRLEQLGMKGFTHAIKVSCEDHEGNGPLLIQQWDGKKWNVISGWIEPMRDVVRPKIEAMAIEEGKKLNYTQRDCSKEK